MSKAKLFMEADYLLGGSKVISEAADAVKFEKETIAKIWEELHDGVLLNLTSFGRMDSIESKEFDAALHELAKLPPTDKMAISYIPSEAMLDTFLKVIDFVDITIDSSQIVFFNSKKNGVFMVGVKKEDGYGEGWEDILFKNQTNPVINKFLQWASKKID
jgi:hypothetical protein